MAITTLSTVKTITGITDQDDLITALIPIVEEDYLAIRNKPFDTGQGLEVTSGSTSAGYIYLTIDEVEYSVYLESDDNAQAVARKIYDELKSDVGISINESSASSSQKLYDKLKYGFDLALDDSTVIFKTPYSVSFNAEDTGVEITSPTVEMLYPFGSEMVAINMIQFRVDNRRNSGVKSESLGDHSITYGESGGIYPKSITSSIKRYVGFR